MQEIKNPAPGQVQLLEGLLSPVDFQLSLAAVLRGIVPGEIWVDDPRQIRSCYIKCPESNVLAGDAANREFCSALADHLDYFDAVTCANPEWEAVLHSVHPNCALRCYPRVYFSLSIMENGRQSKPLGLPRAPAGTQLHFVYARDLKSMPFCNSSIVADWITLVDPYSFPGICLATVLVSGKQIICCSGLDCVVDTAAEIGINTLPEFRGRGYGALTASAMLYRLLDDGIRHIGWHSVTSNKASIRIASKSGLLKAADYSFLAPYPAVENTSDLEPEQWLELARFYEEKAAGSIDQFWQAARCRARAADLAGTMACVNRLLESGQDWCLPFLKANEEFAVFIDLPQWQEYLALTE